MQSSFSGQPVGLNNHDGCILIMKKIYTTPGVLMGLSTSKACKGKSIKVNIDDNDVNLEVDLEHPFPTEETEVGTLPGLEEELFFKRKMVVEYPKELEEHLEVFVSQ